MMGPKSSFSASATMRANTSADPPGGKPTKIFRGGLSCAKADGVNTDKARTDKAKARRERRLDTGFIEVSNRQGRNPLVQWVKQDKM
jgi:hypothetical protein